MLVVSWEREIVAMVSCHLWIEPAQSREPIVEAVLQQLIENGTFFVGSCPAELLSGIAQEIVDAAWLLGRLFQRLGYVGRGSFDVILLGEDPEHARIEFLECSGRWGGALLPMTLMNRRFGDWQVQPYAATGLGEVITIIIIFIFSPCSPCRLWLKFKTMNNKLK